MTDVDFAVFDEKGETLKRFLAASSMRLAPNGRVLVVISNLAELCGLREPFAQVAANAGWRVQLLEQRALPTKEKGFVLEQKRREVLTLFELRRD